MNDRLTGRGSLVALAGGLAAALGWRADSAGAGPAGVAWHADALGVYSGVQGNTGTFMRGIQRTDTFGVARFTTVYPGWYTGRAVHVHVKVHLHGTVVHTGQVFFPEAFTDAAYTRAPYNTRPGRDTRNAADAVFRNGGSRSLLRLHKAASGYTGAITMDVHR